MVLDLFFVLHILVKLYVIMYEDLLFVLQSKDNSVQQCQSMVYPLLALIIHHKQILITV